MGIPYSFVKAMNGEKEPFLEVKGKDPQAKMQYLMLPGRMKGKYLGACLDGCRWGSSTTVMWKTDVRGLMGFIQRWREENNDDIGLYHELPIEQLYTRFELPHINHVNCPRDEKHAGTFVDGGRRTRCLQRTVRGLRPGFIEEYRAGWDELSQMQVREYYEEKPSDPSYCDDEGEDLTDKKEYDKYLRELERFEAEEPSERVIDVCYAIVSDRNVVLPFETILRRKDLAPPTKIVYCGGDVFRTPCRRLDEVDEHLRDMYSDNCGGHEQPRREVIFPFDGWDLAYYLQRWREQSANPPWFAEKQEYWPSNRDKMAPVDVED